MPDHDGPVITYKLDNQRPVDLFDLTGSLAAFGEAYCDYVVDAGYDGEPKNVRLFIRDIRRGSIIADLASLADQASWVLSHLDAAAGFVSHFDGVLRYFLMLPGAPKVAPTRREAAQAIAVLEPVAKDGGAMFFVNVTDGGQVHVHHHYSSQEAAAIQNNARRLLGPSVPTNQPFHDELLSLFQVRGDVSSQVGDRGVIESISRSPTKLIFASEGLKRLVIEQSENPFQKLFVVDGETRTAGGKVRVYLINAVKDVIDRD